MKSGMEVSVEGTTNPKIDIYVDGKYVSTTTWSKTCKSAVERYLNAYPDTQGKVTAHFQSRR